MADYSHGIVDLVHLCMRQNMNEEEVFVSTQQVVLTEEVGEVPRLAVELDGDEECVEEDKDNDEPVEHLRLDDMTHLEPATPTHL